MLKANIAGRDEAAAGSAEWTPSVALASLSLSMLLSSLGTSIANVGLPAFAQAFGASFQDVQWVVLAYLLASTTLIVSVGRLGDITGRRRLLLAGIILFTVASVLCGAAPTLWLLIAARAAQGLGAAIMMALSMAFVGETVPMAKTGRAMGLLGAMSAIDGQSAVREKKGQDAQRHADEEDGPPTRPGDENAAERWTESGADRGHRP